MRYIKILYLDLVWWLVTRLIVVANRLLRHHISLSKTVLNVPHENEPAPVETPPPVETPVVTAPTAEEPLKIQDALMTTEKPSVRHRRRRARLAATQAQEATTAPQEPTAQVDTPPQNIEHKLPAPPINPFTDGSGPIPMCMDPLPEFVVFEAMFRKKYGRFGRAMLNLNGQVTAFTAAELFAFLMEIQSRGEAASHNARAIYGTVMSIVVHQHGYNPKPSDIS